MAVATPLPSSVGQFGPIEALTLPTLREELGKLNGTLSDDHMMGYVHLQREASDFIAELGECIDLSLSAYPRHREVYDQVFSGLQDVINLLHGQQDGLNGADGHPRLLDPSESRLTASERVLELMDDLALTIARDETRKLEQGAPKNRRSTHDDG